MHERECPARARWAPCGVHRSRLRLDPPRDRLVDPIGDCRRVWSWRETAFDVVSDESERIRKTFTSRVEEPENQRGRLVRLLRVNRYPIRAGPFLASDSRRCRTSEAEGCDFQFAFDLGEVCDVRLVVVVLFRRRSIVSAGGIEELHGVGLPHESKRT